MDNIGGILGCLGVAILLALCWVIIFGIVAIPTYVVLSLYAVLKFLGTNTFIALDMLFYPGFDMPTIAAWGSWGFIGGIAIQGYREMRIYGRKGIGVLVALMPLLLLGLISTVKGINAPEDVEPLPKEQQKTTQPTQKPVETTKPIPTTTNQATTDTEKISPTRRIPVRTTKRQDSASPLPVKPTEPRSVPTQQNTVTTPAVELKPPTPSAPVNMVLIPAGEFQMGSNESDDEKPVHTVYTDAFYMDKYEVTNAQYKAFLQANPQWQKGKIASKYHDGDYLKHWNSNNYPSGKANHPVTFVSWYAAMAYAEWAGKRLPTEVEWEKAARGTLVGKKYPWGDSISSTRANYNKDIGDTTFVGKYSSNSYGLYDMAGNVLEWCLDRYDKDFYVSSSRQNPISGESALRVTVNFSKISTAPRVLRGGSWSTLSQSVRVADRTKGPPTLSYFGAGFRCVKDVSH
ncbi:MAG: formylglycine-generating enzyme family protein [Candidatus Poribacteria bacterium]|nr:formylglycine-generating enzyme family protein [Candidatus Poribacteria bacterium]